MELEIGRIYKPNERITVHDQGAFNDPKNFRNYKKQYCIGYFLVLDVVKASLIMDDYKYDAYLILTEDNFVKVMFFTDFRKAIQENFELII